MALGQINIMPLSLKVNSVKILHLMKGVNGLSRTEDNSPRIVKHGVTDGPQGFNLPAPKPKSLRQLAREIGVSPRYLSEIKAGRRPASQKVRDYIGDYLVESVRQSVQQNVHLQGQKYLCVEAGEYGGSVWESNPPQTLFTPANGFEVREAHRDLNAPRLLESILDSPCPRQRP